MRRKAIECVFWILLMLPLAVVSVDNTADWGDDFASYFEEARNIAQQKPFYKIHFRFYDYNDHYAPPYYSVGYPLLLAPIVHEGIPDMHRLDRYMSLWMMAWSLLTVWFLRRHYKLLVVACFMVLFFFNTYFFQCKGRVLSDIPFGFFFLLTIMLYKKAGIGKTGWIITGICLALSIIIRSIGGILAVSICTDLVLAIMSLKAGADRREVINRACIIAITSVLVLTVFHFAFPAPSDAYYLRQFRSAGFHQAIANGDIYLSQLTGFFYNDLPGYSLISRIAGWVVATCLLIGSMYLLSAKRDFIAISFMCYLCVILLFPDNQGFRYLLPIVPLIIYLCISGVKLIANNKYNVVAAILVTSVVVPYSLTLTGMIKDQNKMRTYGPFTRASLHGFAAMNEILPDTAIIACVAPRVVGLMSGHPCCITPEGTTSDQVTKLSMSRPGYLLAIIERDYEAIDRIAIAHHDSLIWEQDGFRLYQCKPWR